MPQLIQGVIPVAHTPFTDDDEIDWPSLERQIDWALDQGADGYCTGMVSELLRLTVTERHELTQRLAAMKRGDACFVASVGAESTKQAVEFARAAEQAGSDGVMAIPPLSSALPDEEIVDYFSAIADSISLPVIVQDASGYVGQAIPQSVYLTLLDRYGAGRILFKPEASPIGPKMSALRDATNGAARIFEGSGGNLLIDSYRRGIAGTIPGMEFLDGVITAWRALQSGDDETAYRVYFPLCALVALQLQAGLDGFLAIEKYVLHKRGLFSKPRRRKPNTWQLDEETRLEVDRLLDLLHAAMDQ
ncbi:MAG: dihydrodipicolinate synthase family protein [Planctomycetales bacterium]|nr:dihydrodipicolinate synthase family protein [Planctomycetales bacterium]